MRFNRARRAPGGEEGILGHSHTPKGGSVGLVSPLALPYPMPRPALPGGGIGRHLEGGPGGRGGGDRPGQAQTQRQDLSP